MTGPNPDAELDEALGIAELPPAAITPDHMERALHVFPFLVKERKRLGGGDPITNSRTFRQVSRVAQAIADAERRGAARVIAEHKAAGT